MNSTALVLEGGIFANIPDCEAGIDLESSHKVINVLMESLQRNFKRDTQYMRPLISPQANIVFALDKDTAAKMVVYMTAKLIEIGSFEEEEFRFTRKSGSGEEMLQRIRLEFPHGVNAHVIHKLLIATDRLERILPCV